MIKEFIQKYKAFILYGIFGVLTTTINIVTYTICYKYFNIENVPSNIIAWILAVFFAFITNKLYVFESKNMEKKVLLSELSKFISSRVLTGIIDVLIMFISVDLLNGPAIIFKFISNTIVIILNYIFSSLIIFKKK